MFGKNDTRHIDLHLPTGWNRCTTEELEAIAAAIIQEQQRVDRYHPFDWSRVKLNVLLSINEITVKQRNEGTTGGDSRNNDYPINFLTEEGNAAANDEWLVQRPQDKEPWPITTGQLVALAERLAWIDDEKASKVIFQFPYPTLRLEVRGERLEVSGPPPLLDGYTWNEYRLLADWMQAYMRHSNAMAQSKTEDVRRKNAEAAENARNEFLAILFKPAGKPTETGAAVANSQLSTLNSQLFEDFSPIKWQVILFWWSSLMSMLAKKFPKVFKQQPVGKGKRRPQQQDTPWDFYNRVTATIQKYIGGLSEQDVNNATYGTILQQLEMMADEAAEMEKLKKRG